VRYPWGSWADILEPANGTSILATYGDQYYSGKAAVVTRKLGKGSVTYIGADSSHGDLEAAILRQVWTTAGATPANLEPDFMLDWRDGFWVAENFTSQSQIVPDGMASEVLVGNRTVPPGGVAIWVE